MTEADQKFYQLWETERTKGKWRFIGLNMIFFFLGLNLLNLVLNYFYMTDAGFIERLEVQKMPTYVLFSALYGLYRWWRNEKRFTKLSGK